MSLNNKLSRRQMLAGLATLAGSALLAACSGGSPAANPTTAPTTAAAGTTPTKAAGTTPTTAAGGTTPTTAAGGTTPTTAAGATPSAAAGATPTKASTGSNTPTTATGQGGPGSSIDSVAITGPVQIVFWHTQTGSNYDALKELVAQYNSTNQDKITVKEEYQGNYTQLDQKIKAAIAANSVPDISVAYESQVADYMKNDSVVALDDYVKSSKYGLSQASLDDIFPAYLETNRFPRYDNKLLSFPFTKSLLVMYYNEDMLKSKSVTIPQMFTWTQFGDACKQATVKDQTWGYAMRTSDASTIDGWFYTRGGGLLTPDLSKVTFDQQYGIDTYQFAADLVKNGYAYVANENNQDQNDFGAGKAAFMMGSSTGRPFIDKAVGGKFKYGLTIIPQGDANKPVTVMYGANMAVYKTNAQKQLAGWLFTKWFTSGEQNIQWAIKSSYMPIRKSAAQSQALQQSWQKDTLGKAAFDLIQYSKPEPNIAGWQDIRPILQDSLLACVTGKQTPKQALDQAAAKANQALAENRS